MAPEKSGGGEEQGTKKAVYAAFTANFLITISKFVAGILIWKRRLAGGGGPLGGRYNEPGLPVG